MIRICALTSMDSSLALKQAHDALLDRHGPVCTLRKFYFKDYEPDDVALVPIEDAVRQADLVLVDVRSDCRMGRNVPRLLQGFEKTVVVLVGMGPETFTLTRMGAFDGRRLFKNSSDRPFQIEHYIKAKKFSSLTKRLGRLLPVGMFRDMRAWVLAQEYYAQGGPDNLESLLLMLLRDYCGLRRLNKPLPPRVLPGYGLYAPDGTIHTDIRAYRRLTGFDPERPTVAMLMHSGMHLQDTAPPALALHAHLKHSVNLVMIFSAVEHNLEALRAYCDGIDLLVTLQYFRLWGGPYGGDPAGTYAFLKERDIPLLIGLRAFETGLTEWRAGAAGLSPIEVALGVTLPELDGAIEPFFLSGLDTEHAGEFGTVKRPVVLPDRAGRFAARIRRRLHLRRTPNRDKKVALLTYSYPPGEDSLASAGYLDVFASLRIFLERLQGSDYSVVLPDEPLKDLFLREGIVNDPCFVARSINSVPAKDYCGWFHTLPEDVRRRVIARWGEPPGKIMVEDGRILVPGVVLGNIFLGVQPARGMSTDGDDSYHDRMLPPHHQYLACYWYLEHVFGADAVVHFGMHGTLEFMPGKEVALSENCFPDVLIGTLPHVYYYWIGNTSEATIAKRRSYALCVSHASPPMTVSGLYGQYLVLEDLLAQAASEPEPDLLALISETARELHLPGEVPELRRELAAMKNRMIPHGLHYLDRRYTAEECADYLAGVLQVDRDLPALWKAVAARQERPEEHAADALHEDVRGLIAGMLQGDVPDWLDRSYGDYVAGAVRRLNGSEEAEGLLRALAGRHVEPARGGDPVRDPEVYPSGRAMYAFDPRLIPTVAAERRGRVAAERLLALYQRSHGRYPESVGIVLWGFETMKTGGDTVAMILHLLGVRIRHRCSPWTKDLEIVPPADLGRPRIDVVITMCGIFRDTFGMLIDLMNRALALAAAADERAEDNYLKKHHAQQPETADGGAPARIFGPAPSDYATGIPEMIAQGAWSSEAELADEFCGAISHAYAGGRVRPDEPALRRALGTVDLVVQERDSHEYEVTDLDHYYEFLGGLSKSVVCERGEGVAVLVVDQTGAEPRVEPLQDVLERATRTRTLNPRWIDGMLRHDHHGAKIIKDRVEHLLGFAATTGMVDSWLFDALADTLVLDPNMRERLQANNPYALRRMAEVLIESERRSYWQPDAERLSRLRDVFLAMESALE